MASALKGTNYTINEAFNPASASIIGQGKWGGKVRVQNDACDVSSIEAASTIKIGRLPKGATLLWGRIFIEANGTNVTFAVGDGTTADKFMAATAAAAASMLSFPNLIAQANLSVTVDTDIIITTAGATIAATKAIKTQVAYLLE